MPQTYKTRILIPNCVYLDHTCFFCNTKLGDESNTIWDFKATNYDQTVKRTGGGTCFAACDDCREKNWYRFKQVAGENYPRLLTREDAPRLPPRKKTTLNPPATVFGVVDGEEETVTVSSTKMICSGCKKEATMRIDIKSDLPVQSICQACRFQGLKQDLSLLKSERKTINKEDQDSPPPLEIHTET